jgi:hypothetical protein
MRKCAKDAQIVRKKIFTKPMKNKLLQIEVLLQKKLQKCLPDYNQAGLPD